MKIGILGGTFDPIHEGHLRLARAAQKQYQLDKVLFVPALIPPHKTMNREMTPAPYRYRMVELALEGEPHFQACDLEFNRPDISYTLDTLRILKQQSPQDEFYLILGADSAAEFSSWHQPGEIVKLAHLLVAKRKGFDARQMPYSFKWIDMTECDLSATDLRQKVEKKQALPQNSLKPGVNAFIQQQKLYQKVSRGPAS